MADVEEAVTAEMKQPARWRRYGRKRSSGRRTSSWPAPSIRRISLASGPRIYGTMLSTGGTVADVDAWPQRISAVTPAEVQAAAQYVWRDDGAVTAMLTPAEGSR